MFELAKEEETLPSQESDKTGLAILIRQGMFRSKMTKCQKRCMKKQV